MTNISQYAKSTSSRHFKLLFLTASLASLLGCQTTHSPEQSLKSFDLTDSPISANTAYQQQVADNNNRYQQLFTKTDSADENAKNTLLNALNTHLSSNHVAISQTRMHETPFFEPNSVDAESQNSFISILEGSLSALELFKLRNVIFGEVDFSDEDDYEDDEYDYEDDVAADIKEIYEETVYEKALYEEELDSDDDAYDNSDDEESITYYGDEEKFAGPTYRTEDDYLLDGDALYLNYIDEKQGSLPTPNYKVTRVEGLSASSYDDSNLVVSYLDDIYSCAVDFSYDLDIILETEPGTKHDDEGIKALEATFQECLNEVSKDEPEILALSNVYQRQYVKLENACVDRFTKQTSDYLVSDRSNDKDLKTYYNTWRSYNACDYSVFLLNDLEPVTYISYGWPQYFLDYKQQIVQCTDEMIASEDEAARKGITYKNNPQHYLDINEDFIECKQLALDEKTKYEIENDLVEELTYGNDDYDYGDYDYEEESEYEKQQRVEAIQKAVAMMQITPAQIEANNFYYYQYLTLNQLSAYDAKQKKYNSVYSFDYASPSSYTSVQLPLGIDFKQGSMTLDPSAILPFVALMAPENTPLPDEMVSTTVAFGLPEELSRNFPLEVVYDALITAINHSLTELDSSNFTALDISQDPFAKELGARRAVKVNLDAYQSGKMFGVIVKHMANSLQTHVTNHPEAYEHPEDIVDRLEQWQELSVTFLTDDIGRMTQTLETFLPITFNKINTYYLDSSNRLIGKQVSTAIGSDLAGRNHTTTTQTRFDSGLKQSPLASLFEQSFGQPFTQNNIKSVDGNAWLKNIKDREKSIETAREARSGYGYYNRDTNSYQAYDDDYYQSQIRIIDSGNVNDYLDDESSMEDYLPDEDQMY
ncbi:hypothetical protein [Psychrobacter sp. FDAARGOS_221]|uniref:hypothetical protein n=1 Tax=Psychrobacter sp. FDAARGOS_221 TaxID=1975705 RepID=UPI000BB59F26|nr:hypothetical protein [Psychrobacter sp. FDAARGOS_221]PNK59650.1 hypothetical protein A6J60_001305 [Psychrobacter sp. FDAARGOS_221]